MAKKNCLHRYKLKDLNRKTDKPYMVYVCTKQTCSHHIRVDLVDGKLAECNRCGEPFVMKMARLKHGDKFTVTPHCNECTKTPKRFEKKKAAIKETESSIDELMNSILPKGL